MPSFQQWGSQLVLLLTKNADNKTRLNAACAKDGFLFGESQFCTGFYADNGSRHACLLLRSGIFTVNDGGAADLAGLEPAACGLEDRCSIQLS